ncbi:GNAT family N-acetyltransferase [Fictibacillus aquaticus]|uniref:N-acetyltransferase domain-containing protein n=1 Tax=Fictibacillus aquaticus TaxID=2021314 RepID=A0A235FDF7_9BACL|nr:GNAT family N-acetyltransferase [Fictibacillus aquaticus]OYD59388.1 hypothetical protein CGZ90_05725 [Fictibacillus aquaticus]
MVTIRKAELSDLSFLSDLYTELSGYKTNLDLMKRNFKVISNNPNYFVVVAEDNQVIVGTAMGIICSDLVGNCNPFLLIENVVVTSSFRGKGIGQLLMKFLKKIGNENNCNYVILISGEVRTDAHSFYEKVGYDKQLGYKKRLQPQTNS